MDFIKSVFLYLAKKMGLELQDKPAFPDDYSDIDHISLTAVIANKLATLSMQDSNITIEGDGARARFMQSFLDYYLGERMDTAAEVALGTGDCLVKPYTNGKRLGVDIIKNRDFVVCESVGNNILSCIVKVGEVQAENGELFERFEIQAVRPSRLKTGQEVESLLIHNVAFRNHREVPLSDVPGWEGIAQTITIPNMSKPLFGRYKSPVVNRRDVNGVNGVKATYGLDSTMDKAVEAYERFNREYQAKETLIFADKTLLTKDGKGDPDLPRGKKSLFLLMRGIETGDLIHEHSPDIRGSDLEKGIEVNNRMVELLAGLSQGILTPPTTSYATATEMRAALNSTFAVITKFRRTLEKGTNDLLEAINTLANLNNLSPIGSWRAQYDWSAAYIEQMNEHFNQLVIAEGIGAVDKAEVRAWLKDEDYEEARARVEQISEESGADLLEEPSPFRREPMADE